MRGLRGPRRKQKGQVKPDAMVKNAACARLALFLRRIMGRPGNQASILSELESGHHGMRTLKLKVAWMNSNDVWTIHEIFTKILQIYCVWSVTWGKRAKDIRDTTNNFRDQIESCLYHSALLFWTSWKGYPIHIPICKPLLIYR